MSALRRVVAALLFAAGGVPCVAQAQDADAIARARTLFEDGKRLLENKQFEKACPMLAESSRLAAATGPLLALAMCHEGEGKTASAWSEYHEVVARTRLQGQTDWAERAGRAATLLEPRLARLRIVLDAGARSVPAFVVKRDGKALGPDALDVPVPVDPGVHVVEASALGREPWSTQVLVADGATLSIAVPAPTRVPDHRATRPLLRTVGIATGAAGLVALGFGTYFALRAVSKNADSENDCTGDSCGPSGKQARLDAISSASVATAAFIAGGAMLVGGVTLFVIGKAGANRPTVTVNAVGGAPLAGLMALGAF